YKSKSGREVDFVVPGRGRPRALIQVCESLADPGTRARETSALEAAMAETGLRSGTIVTKNETERIETDDGPIEVVPAWRFLLDQPDSGEEG
ncbi:MAG TPA: ATP-binding protein, partial [Thermoanaerobaculia bacterium]|nr:ATP-binding protein [Thermoanaerobaculia bacterium]